MFVPEVAKQLVVSNLLPVPKNGNSHNRQRTSFSRDIGGTSLTHVPNLCQAVPPPSGNIPQLAASEGKSRVRIHAGKENIEIVTQGLLDMRIPIISFIERTYYVWEIPSEFKSMNRARPMSDLD